MTFRFLSDDVLAKVQRTAIGLGFAGDAGLNAGVSPAFVGSFATGATDVAKLLTLSRRMNVTRALVSGEVPLMTWLQNAITMAGSVPEERVFLEALELASADGIALPTDPVPQEDLPAEIAALPRGAHGLQVVIGEDDTIDVAFLHDGAAVARSVAKLAVHRHFDGRPSTLAGGKPDLGLGTGWVLAPGLLITNWHVVDARLPLEPMASTADFELQGKSTQVQFDFYDRGKDGHTVHSVSCAASNRELDYAILQLSDDERPALRLRTEPVLKPASRALRERVNVLQHPRGEPMRLGFRNNFVVTGTDDRLSYLTDTAGGASGSPICDDAWFVAALHRGWRMIPGDPVEVWGRSIKQENYGTPIGLILADLKDAHPDLYAQVSVQK
ncbi:serine protease [Lentzea sp. NBC_00516]|uniref:trypsin-like peptidase domain-containing protein n=1 Tax=Lentzea sp. NBC_00516 TaxID=2903582 RepID=UPI002E80FA18|nr:trypsin-like peptidase domain-containing protein [Lentzea sp. NBC_00516]WUD29281.1 serine protease [Lentzea sp. NBC_00516]